VRPGVAGDKAERMALAQAKKNGEKSGRLRNCGREAADLRAWANRIYREPSALTG